MIAKGYPAVIEATIAYPKGHRITYQYTRDKELYCPNCGVLGHIWFEYGLGDYYVGPSHYCGACTATFTIQDNGLVKEDHIYFATIEAIRAAKRTDEES